MKQHELCINGLRIRMMANPKPHYTFEYYSASASRWMAIRTNEKLHKMIVNRDK